MKERGARFISREPASLSGYQLVFNVNRHNDGFAFANIEPDPNSMVHGALYICEPGSLKSLDADHVDVGIFKRIDVKVKRASGETINASAYIATGKEFLKEGLKPSKEYLSEILEGEDIVPANYFTFLKSFEETKH